ncbi:Protein NRT1/ PTR FAMILY 5.6 like [Actinidia chinensis var. chinensis]|uniref:Protein NRT1/ PTR FAMILY 5.6 like n=1 Tax=Actinidia chinensis var. chinensis TaxID=1590841 RepID=A0A2R6QKD4_ACTCC|nr:Protein NRT1/ PTR FAMILY 5.6 like [Actinidia chinensis var. chinensis]
MATDHHRPLNAVHHLGRSILVYRVNPDYTVSLTSLPLSLSLSLFVCVCVYILSAPQMTCKLRKWIFLSNKIFFFWSQSSIPPYMRSTGQSCHHPTNMDEERERGKSLGVDEEKWVYDSSLDHKGRIPLRASTGVWKASIFIIRPQNSSKNSNYWAGVTTVLPLLGGFFADAYLGRFSTVLASSIVYLLGLILLTMSRVVPNLKPCEASNCQEPRKIHEVVFFLAIYLISLGTGGHKPALESLGADQFDDDHPRERIKKMSFFNWWNFGVAFGVLLGVTAIVYVQDHMSWAAADIGLTTMMAGSTVVFCTGRSFYRYRKPMGSPLTPMLHVLVAAIRKRELAYPSNTAELYEVSKTENHGRLLRHTHKLKFLDKAAIVEDKEGSTEKQQSPWRLATVTKVEELKLILNMIPIWLATLPFGICVAQTSTFFIKQGTMLDRKIGRSFLIPPASLYALAAIGMIISVMLYEKVLLPFLRKATGNERGIKILQRIGIGMVFSVVTMIVAALVERKRLGLVEKNPFKGSTTMSVFWLAPQFFIIGFGDGFALVGLQEYFYDQVPDSMRSLGIAFYLSVIGVANFISSLLITIVDRVTEKWEKSWFGADLNNSRLDNFYWFLAIITAVNLGGYVVLAQRYSYKNVQERGVVTMANCYGGGDGGFNPLFR